MPVPRAVLLSCLLLAASCHSDSRGPDAASPGPDGGTMDMEAGATDGEVADAGADADLDGAVEELDPTVLTNFSFDDAKHVDIGPTGVLQPVERADQVDYYSFEAEAGEVYVITALRGRFSPDNVLTLYSPSREKLAENDSGRIWPGDLIDARLVIRAEETGTYYVTAEDRVLPEQAFGVEGVPLFYYRLTITRADTSEAGTGWAADGSGEVDVSFALDMASGVSYVTLLGELEAGEVDLFKLHGGAAQALIGHVLPGGVMGNGSTLTAGHVDIRDTDDALVAEIDRGRGLEHIHPPVEDADYTLAVTADGEAGERGFYAIDLVLLTDNPLEDPTDNDSIEAAHAIALEGGFLRRGTVLAEVPPGDVDYFAFEAMAGERLDVTCEGESAGSGVRGLMAEIRDAADEVVGTAREALDTGLRLEAVIAPEAGSYYVRLSSAAPGEGEVAPAWVRCAVIAER